MAMKKMGYQTNGDIRVLDTTISKKAQAVIRKAYKEFLDYNKFDNAEMLLDFVTVNDVITLYRFGVINIKKERTLVYNELVKFGLSEEEIIGSDTMLFMKRDEILKDKLPIDYKTMNRFPYNVIRNVFSLTAMDDIILECMNDYWKELDYTTRVYSAISTLRDERMIRIILLRSIDNLSYEEIGKIFGLTKSRIQQIEMKGYRMLAHPSRSKKILHGMLYYEELAYEALENQMEEQKKFYERQIAELKGEVLPEEPNEEDENSPLKTPLEDLDLSCRSFNCLTRAGIRTLGDIVSMTELEMMKVRNLGRKSLEEVVNKIAMMGFHLADESTETHVSWMEKQVANITKVKDINRDMTKKMVKSIDDDIVLSIIKRREEEQHAQAEHNREMEARNIELKIAEASKIDKLAEYRKIAEDKFDITFPERLRKRLVNEVISLGDDERVIAILLRTEKYDPRKDDISESPFNRFVRELGDRSALRKYDYERLASLHYGQFEVDKFTVDGVEYKTPWGAIEKQE